MEWPSPSPYDISRVGIKEQAHVHGFPLGLRSCDVRRRRANYRELLQTSESLSSRRVLWRSGTRGLRHCRQARRGRSSSCRRQSTICRQKASSRGREELPPPVADHLPEYIIGFELLRDSKDAPLDLSSRPEVLLYSFVGDYGRPRPPARCVCTRSSYGAYVALREA